MSHNQFWNLLSKKLSGEAMPEDLEELGMLLKQHPELSYPAEQVERLWKLQSKVPGSYDSELAFQQHINQLDKKGIHFPELETPETYYPSNDTRSRKFKTIYTSAAAFVIAFIAFIVIWQNRLAPSPEILIQGKNFTGEVSTGMGDRTQLVLPDSTVVWLNAGSKLTYNKQFGITNRNTTLSGEAFFDVRKSPMPFIIQANGVQIKVLGTAFNVKSYPNEKTTETSLIRGKVEITLDKRPGEKFILKPNEKLVVANDHKPADPDKKSKTEPMVVLSHLTHANDNTIIETSWVNNKLIFQDESFKELAVKMERWYGFEIEFTNERIARERLSGTFTRESIQEALDILQMTTSFRYSIRSNKITITD